MKQVSLFALSILTIFFVLQHNPASADQLNLGITKQPLNEVELACLNTKGFLPSKVTNDDPTQAINEILEHFDETRKTLSFGALALTYPETPKEVREKFTKQRIPKIMKWSLPIVCLQSRFTDQVSVEEAHRRLKSISELSQITPFWNWQQGMVKKICGTFAFKKHHACDEEAWSSLTTALDADATFFNVVHKGRPRPAILSASEEGLTIISHDEYFELNIVVTALSADNGTGIGGMISSIKNATGIGAYSTKIVAQKGSGSTRFIRNISWDKFTDSFGKKMSDGTIPQEFSISIGASEMTTHKITVN